MTTSPRCGMAGFDDLAGRRIEPAPEAERLVEHECRTGRVALDERSDPSISRPRSPRRGARWPAAADRTHSSRLPSATSNPRLLGAYHAHFPESVITGRSTPWSTGVMYVHVSVTTVTPASARSSATVADAGELRAAGVHVEGDARAFASRPASASRRSSASEACGRPYADGADLRAVGDRRQLVPRGAEIGEGDDLLAGSRTRATRPTSSPRASRRSRGTARPPPSSRPPRPPPSADPPRCPAGAPRRRDLAAAPPTEEMPEHRVQEIVVEQPVSDAVQAEQHAGAPAFVGMQAVVRHPAGDRRADVDEVAVAVRPRARGPSSRTRSRSTRPTRRVRPREGRPGS